MLFDKRNKSPLENCLDCLIAITMEAEAAIDHEDPDLLMKCLDRRRSELEVLDRLSLDPVSLSAHEMARKARLLAVNHRMIAKAEDFHSKNRRDLCAIRNEKRIKAYGINHPEPIQALDVRE